MEVANIKWDFKKKIYNSARIVSCYLMLRILSNEFQKTTVDKET
jgi:hypothetical protein